MEELGDDAEILSARRVRRGGVGGFFASEHVEVSARRVARPRPVPAEQVTIDLSDRAAAQRDADLGAQAMAFEDHLQQMVLAVEHEEAPAARDAGAPPRADSMRTESMPRRLTDADLAPLPPAPPAAAPAPRPAAVPPVTYQPMTYEPMAPEPVALEPVVLEPVVDDRRPRRPPRKSAAMRRGPQWSISNLRRLGVAEEVLRRIVTPQPATDAAWTMALERAISDALPTTESRDRIAMHGYGAESAVTLLASALRGHRVDYIHLRERTAPASALELALAIRSCLCQ
jgi:hypothetical protein